MEIEPPTPKKMQAIVQKIYENCLLDMKLQHYFNAALTLKLLSKLCLFSPRRITEEIRLAIGKACIRAKQCQKVELTIRDFELSSISQNIENSYPSDIKDNMH